MPIRGQKQMSCSPLLSSHEIFRFRNLKSASSIRFLSPLDPLLRLNKLSSRPPPHHDDHVRRDTGPVLRLRHRLLKQLPPPQRAAQLRCLLSSGKHQVRFF